MDTSAYLEIDISEDAVPPERIQTQAQPVLTHLSFGQADEANPDYLSIQTNINVLSANVFAQYWFTDQQVKLNQFKNIHYAHNDQMMFGHLQLKCTDNDDFHQLSLQAYSEIYACLAHVECKHLLRTWNYFPQITKPGTQLNPANRYELFCSGRRSAMQNCGIEHKIYPAATVIGNQENCLQVYFLASDVPGIAVENPRQTSAYKYPVNDQQMQPLFSRGLLKVWGARTHFYVSGTASIVGHETLHENDVCAQLNEAINNVETLVAHANDQYHTQLNAQDDLLYMKVYLRNKQDSKQIEQVLAARLSNNTPRILLHGHMCRDDLLVEIEAFYQA